MEPFGTLADVHTAQEGSMVEPLCHQGVRYIAFFISLSLSITASAVDLPVAFLQPPS